MVTTTMGRGTPLSASQVLTTTGLVTTLFSVVAGALVLFVIPGACSFLGGLEVVMLAFLFVFGVAAFTVGKILGRRKKVA